MSLESLGWNASLAQKYQNLLASGFKPARVIAEHKEAYRVHDGDQTYWGEISGKLLYQSASSADFPKIGDWVAITAVDQTLAVIHTVLPRQTILSRKKAGDTTEEQIIAANIQVVFIVMGLDQNFNLRRLERYLTTVQTMQARPVIVLNKTDVCSDLSEKLQQVEALASNHPIISLSALDPHQVQPLLNQIHSGETAVLVGSSGVGKSTLINALLGEKIQNVQSVRKGDEQGKHTTSHKTLFILEGQRCFIDTPGMRELQLWQDGSSLEKAFPDIDVLAGQCQFKNCSHTQDKGCAIQSALIDGSLDEKRFKNYLKLKKELLYLETKIDEKKARQVKQDTKKLHSYYRKVIRHKNKDRF